MPLNKTKNICKNDQARQLSSSAQVTETKNSNVFLNNFFFFGMHGGWVPYDNFFIGIYQSIFLVIETKWVIRLSENAKTR